MRHSRLARMLLVCAGVACVPCAARADGPSLIDIAISILNEAVHAPIPTVLGPLVTAAENADSIAVAGLETWCGLQDRQLLVQLTSASGQQAQELERKLKAVQELKAALNRIKAKRQEEEKKKKEDGWDPFYCRYAPTAPVALPGINSFTMIADGFEDRPGDMPAGPVVALTTPPWCGSTNWLLPVFSSAASASFTPGISPGSFNVSITSFAQTIGSFEVASGTPTGPNTGSLNEFGSAPAGTMSPFGLVDMYWEGKYTNALYSGRTPILFFAATHGVMKPTGEAITMADDPMIVPMPPALAPAGEPWLRGACVWRFDAGTGTLTMGENTNIALPPDLAMMRDSEKRHTYRPAEDRAVGAKLMITPIVFIGAAGSAFLFADTPFSVVRGSDVLLAGTVRSITLDSASHIFEGTLDVAPDVPGPFSRSANQIASALGARRLAFAGGGTVVDLISLTSGFTASATMPWPDIFAIEAKGGSNCPADLNGDLTVDDADFVVFLTDYNELLVPPASPWSDLNADNAVDDADFSLFASAYNDLLCP
ncbi:MAG: hypothetical protein JNK16_00525 [Phycisphaerales bacterium]|nr:hypothetical protein [Phycisphaerales bacterium]